MMKCIMNRVLPKRVIVVIVILVLIIAQCLYGCAQKDVLPRETESRTAAAAHEAAEYSAAEAVRSTENGFAARQKRS